MNIYDCFMYHDEDLVLDIRLNTLNDFVKKFVIVESKFDHQGNKKKLNFNLDNFKKFKDKIIYKIIENFPLNQTNWERENFQRNYISNGLTSALDEDYIIISDVDEIPNLESLKNFQDYKYTVFEQKMFYYKINLLNKTYPIWYGSKMCKKKYLKSPQWLRNQKVKKHSFWKFYRINWNFVQNGGWHFSFLYDVEGIIKKISSFQHTEFDKDEYKNKKTIEKKILNGEDIFNRNFKFKKIEIDSSFPEYILKNINKYKEWLKN